MRLAPGLKPIWIEIGRPGLYSLATEDTFELDLEAWAALREIHEGRAGTGLLGPLKRAALANGILVPAAGLATPFPLLPPSEAPFLRYLNLEIHQGCNLRCAHCYHGTGLEEDQSLDLGLTLAALADFAALGGLAASVAGGEPSLHPGFWELNERAPEIGVRMDLFTNGVGMPVRRVPELRFHRVRVSLDGLAAGHQSIRGPATFEPAVRFARAVKDHGLDLVISTMLHRGSEPELDGLERLVREDLEASAWLVSAPMNRGAWMKTRDLLGLSAARAGELAERYGFGEGGAFSKTRPSCDSEMLTVQPNGRVVSCSMLPTTFNGNLREDTLLEIWGRRAATLRGTKQGSLACQAACP